MLAARQANLWTLLLLRKARRVIWTKSPRHAVKRAIFSDVRLLKKIVRHASLFFKPVLKLCKTEGAVNRARLLH